MQAQLQHNYNHPPIQPHNCSCNHNHTSIQPKPHKLHTYSNTTTHTPIQLQPNAHTTLITQSQHYNHKHTPIHTPTHSHNHNITTRTTEMQAVVFLSTDGLLHGAGREQPMGARVQGGEGGKLARQARYVHLGGNGEG